MEDISLRGVMYTLLMIVALTVFIGYGITNPIFMLVFSGIGMTILALILLFIAGQEIAKKHS